MDLQNLHLPNDLNNFSIEELEELCGDLKREVQSIPNAKEGHVCSSIAVTELTVALHKIFNTPTDILVWDVGHQSYIHKMITGRYASIDTLRQKGGLSGFTRSAESEYDPFGAGHSSTAISAVVGFAVANRLNSGSRKHIAVVGDGAFTGGMCYEALNYLGQEQLDVLIVLNDNQSSIDKNVGHLAINGDYKGFCSSLGIEYLGEVESGSVKGLIEELKKAKGVVKPRLLRVLSQKPKQSKKNNAKARTSFQSVFTESLIKLAKEDERIVAISPAMLSGSGLNKFQKEFPTRTFDVGIAEQHAVTMAAALAADGFIPIVHLYSSFSQRAYDQIVHDVLLQGLHVIFCFDRAGLVGEDGATHHGNFDPGFINTLPGATITAPMDGEGLRSSLHHAISGKGAWFIRYPKSDCNVIGQKTGVKELKPSLLKKGSKKVVLSFGVVGLEVEKALANTQWAHYDFSVLKPLNREFLLSLAKEYSVIYTIEENSPRGGLGDSLRSFYSEAKIHIPVYSKALPDQFIEHASREELLRISGLKADSILSFVSKD